MDRRLQKLQSRTNVLRDLVQNGLPPDMNHVLTCEVLISELREEYDALGKEFKAAATPAMKKLARDFGKISPQVTDILAKANQACFDARFEIEARSRKESSSNIASENSGGSTLDNIIAKEEPAKNQVQIDQQLSFQQQEENDVYAKDIEKELVQIGAQAHSVRALTENVAMMVAHQADDIQQVVKANNHARDDVVAGLDELAQAKKREAGNHTTRSTTVSAVIGGAVGLVGGPVGVALGAAAGAAVGAAIGSSIASLSRRSIDREVRAFKNKFRIEIGRDGSCSTYAEVYENERWSLSLKTWTSDSLLPTDGRSRWSLDEFGKPLSPKDPSPLYPEMPPRAPNDQGTGPAKVRAVTESSSAQGTGLLEEESVSSLNDEFTDSSFSGIWRWTRNSKWMPDMSDRNADASGWQYAFSFAEGAVWYPQPNRTCFVRRRRWIRDQVLDPQKAHHPERIALIAMERKRNEAEEPKRLNVPVTLHASIDGATRDLGQSVQASQATLDELRRQGLSIHEAAYDVAIAEDASIHAQRVSRAVTMSGVFRNAFSSAPDATERTQLRRMTEEAKSEAAAAKIIEEANSTSKVGWDHPVDVLERLAGEQLTMSKVIHGEVIHQNKQLDILNEATARGERRIQKAKDMI